MEYIMLAGSFFDFDMSKLATPLTIIGIVLIVLSIFLVAASSKIDEKIRAKKSKNIEKDTSDSPSNDAGAEKDSEQEDINMSDESSHEEIAEQDEENVPLFRHSDGSINYYMILKLTGLVMVLVSAVMIIVGMK